MLHKFLIAKLHVYGAQLPSLKTVQRYRVNRKQRTQINNFYRWWSETPFSNRNREWKQTIFTGHGQKLPSEYRKDIFLNQFLFNIFLYVTFFVPKFDIASYADNSTLFCSGKHIKEVISNLKNTSETRLKWFCGNCMKANPGKYY